MQRILVRHATPLVAAGTCYGALDVAADAQATLLAAQALNAHLPTQIALQLPEKVVALVSPLQRCRQLADVLQSLRDDLTFIVDPRLAEMDFGVWEGVAWNEIPRAAVDAWTADFANHRFGGKESVSEVLRRVGSAWDDVPEALLWITHAGVMRAASLVAAGRRHIDHAQQWPLSAPAYGEWLSLRRSAA